MESIDHMKVIRFGSPGREKLGILTPEGRRLDVSGLCHDYSEQFLGSDSLAELAQWLKNVPQLLRRLIQESVLVRRFAAPARLPA
jgi:hypothetical protein